MKRATTLIAVCFVFCSVGCSISRVNSNSAEDDSRTIKGVLIEVDRKAYSNCWRLLKFEGGLEATIRSPSADKWYIGHYQEITVDSEGQFVSNKSDSYDDLARDFKKRDYSPQTLARRNDE